MLENTKKNIISVHNLNRLSLTRSFIYGISASFICGFILANTLRLDKPNLLIFILGAVIFGIILGISISMGIKRYRYGNKKNIFILITFCSFLIYFVSCITFMYILFHNTSNYEFYKELYDKDANTISPIIFMGFTLLEWPLKYGGSYYTSSISPLLIDLIRQLTLYKISTNSLITIINILILLSMLLLSILCSWAFIILTCPWLASGKKKGLFQFFIEKFQRQP